MKIAVGSDHAGFMLKNRLRDLLHANGHDVTDYGTQTPASSDYPDYAALVGHAVVSGKSKLGILVCGTGIGVSIAANKVHGVRAAACSDPVTARLARSHNNANVLCMGERIIGPEVADAIVQTFLETPFSEGERHIRRIAKVTELEHTEDQETAASC
ncbi:MAG: ribose 5-phosphate isomerase B [Chthonomonadales bacterium]